MRGQPALCRQIGTSRGEDEPPRLSQGGRRIHQMTDLSTFAEKMLLHESAVVKIRDDVPLDQVALIGCGVTTGLGAVLNTAKVEPGSTVAVIGCGGVGLSCIQGAVLTGAGRIIAIDTVPGKLELAKKVGATDVVDASSGGVVDQILQLTGKGVDYSFEVIGTKATAEQAFDMLDRGGTAVIIGMVPEGTKIEIEASYFLEERTIRGSLMGSNRFRIDMPRYVEFYMQGRLKLDELISKRIKLDQVNQAFEEMKQGHLARSVITFD